MTGITYTLDVAALDAVKRLNRSISNPAPLLRDIGEYLMIAHMRRFATQTSPEGTPWQPLSPEYQKSKKKNKNRILYLDGYLANLLRYQLQGDNELLFGSDRVYAAIHHFGGQITRKGKTWNMPARPFVGVSDSENTEIAQITMDYLQSAL